MINLPKLIPLIEAAKRMGLPVADLRLSIKTGTIATGVFTSPDGEILVSENVIDGTHTAASNKPRKRQLTLKVKRGDFSHLNGQPISQSAAAEKYQVPQSTISRWMRRGLIERIGSDGYRVFLDEGDVAYATKVYLESGGKQGKRIMEGLSINS